MNVTRPHPKRHESMTGESSILAYYMACLDQDPDTLDLTQVASRGEIFGKPTPNTTWVCNGMWNFDISRLRPIDHPRKVDLTAACHGLLRVFISERSSNRKRWNPFVTTSAAWCIVSIFFYWNMRTLSSSIHPWPDTGCRGREAAGLVYTSKNSLSKNKIWYICLLIPFPL